MLTVPSKTIAHVGHFIAAPTILRTPAITTTKTASLVTLMHPSHVLHPLQQIRSPALPRARQQRSAPAEGKLKTRLVCQSASAATLGHDLTYAWLYRKV